MTQKTKLNLKFFGYIILGIILIYGSAFVCGYIEGSPWGYFKIALAIIKNLDNPQYAVVMQGSGLALASSKCLSPEIHRDLQIAISAGLIGTPLLAVIAIIERFLYGPKVV